MITSSAGRTAGGIIKKALWQTLGIAVGASIVAAVGIAGLWVGDRRPPLKILEPSKLISGGFHPGESVAVETKVERLRSCKVKIERWFIDANKVRHLLPDYDFDAIPSDLMGTGVLRIEVPIPIGAAEGVGKYRSMLSYICNPIQGIAWPITVFGADVDITVVKSPRFKTGDRSQIIYLQDEEDIQRARMAFDALQDSKRYRNNPSSSSYVTNPSLARSSTFYNVEHIEPAWSR